MMVGVVVMVMVVMVRGRGVGDRGGVGVTKEAVPLRRRRRGGRRGGGAMKEGMVVVGGAVMVMGRLGRQVSLSLLGQEGRAVAACCWCTGSPRGGLRGRRRFVKVLARQQAVVRQAAVTRRVVRRRRLIGQAFEAGGGGGRLGDVGGASRAGGPGRHRRQHSGV